MLSMRTASAMHAAASTHPDPHFRELLALRLAQLDSGDETDLAELVHIIVFDVGDGLEALEAELGFSPLRNDSDGTVFGQPDFTPTWEWIANHGGWFELVYVFSDWGNGAIVYVRHADGVEPALIDLCAASAN
jgi:hypothetical protein